MLTKHVTGNSDWLFWLLNTENIYFLFDGFLYALQLCFMPRCIWYLYRTRLDVDWVDIIDWRG